MDHCVIKFMTDGSCINCSHHMSEPDGSAVSSDAASLFSLNRLSTPCSCFPSSLLLFPRPAISRAYRRVYFLHRCHVVRNARLFRSRSGKGQRAQTARWFYQRVPDQWSGSSVGNVPPYSTFLTTNSFVISHPVSPKQAAVQMPLFGSLANSRNPIPPATTTTSTTTFSSPSIIAGHNPARPLPITTTHEPLRHDHLSV
jgi:hypothetical protein